MKLTKVRVRNFQSIQDSNEFDIGDITCLVGKNEAGKTALLKALYRLNPAGETNNDFNTTNDYPRRNLGKYNKAIRENQQEPAQVVQATYALEQPDLEDFLRLPKVPRRSLEVESISEREDSLVTPRVPRRSLEVKSISEHPERYLTLSKGYSNELTWDGQIVDTDPDIKHLIERVPKFLYFDEYYQMKGCDNIQALMRRVEDNTLEESDQALLGLIEIADIDLEDMLETTETEYLTAKLEAAGNTLTEKVLQYWSQNQNLKMKFDIREGRSGDPPGMTSGTNLWARIENTIHGVTTLLGTRSRGFVWFFSFLAYYEKLRQENENLILLFDEPGLFLHARAQEDLLRYFEAELKNDHQLIYTTHSPFMVDSTRFDRVKIVEDLSIPLNHNDLLDEQQGTKVITEVLKATRDSLFPLQGALGYEIYQTLFIGPNNLVVEGVSDLLYIQTISALLQKKGKAGLSSDWTLTPVGSSSKVPTFVALIGASTKLNIAVLVDYQKTDQQKIESLYKEKLLKKNQVFTYADFVESDEADIEDMFAPEFYLKLVNDEFQTSLTVNDLPPGPPRILPRLEKHFESNPLPNGAKFNHYRPALYLSKNLASLEEGLTELDLDRFQGAFDVLNKLLDKLLVTESLE